MVNFVNRILHSFAFLALFCVFCIIYTIYSVFGVILHFFVILLTFLIDLLCKLSYILFTKTKTEVNTMTNQANPDDAYDPELDRDPEQVSKCYKEPDFMGFKCDDCDCKDFS